MIASDWVGGVLVVVGDQGALVGRAGLPVPPDRGGHGQQALGDPDVDAGQGAAAVSFQPELVLEGVEGAFDPLAPAAQRAVPAWLVGAVGAQQPDAKPGEVVGELAAGEALVAQDEQSWAQAGALVVEHGGHDLAFAQLRRGQAPRDRQPVRCGQHVQPEAPEVAVVALAVAVAGMAGQRRAADRLAAGRARYRGGVDQAQLVPPARRVDGEVLDGERDLGCRAAQPPVVGRWGRQVGEQVAQPLGGEAQPAPLGAEPQQDLRDGQADQLGVAELGRPAGRRRGGSGTGLGPAPQPASPTGRSTTGTVRRGPDESGAAWLLTAWARRAWTGPPRRRRRCWTPCSARRRSASGCSTPSCATCASTRRWRRSTGCRPRPTWATGPPRCCARSSSPRRPRRCSARSSPAASQPSTWRSAARHPTGPASSGTGRDRSTRSAPRKGRCSASAWWSPRSPSTSAWPRRCARATPPCGRSWTTRPRSSTSRTSPAATCWSTGASSSSSASATGRRGPGPTTTCSPPRWPTASAPTTRRCWPASPCSRWRRSPPTPTGPTPTCRSSSRCWTRTALPTRSAASRSTSPTTPAPRPSCEPPAPSWNAAPPSWNAPTPSWSSSPTPPPTTCASRCAPSPATASCSSGASATRSTSRAASCSTTPSTGRHGC